MTPKRRERWWAWIGKEIRPELVKAILAGTVTLIGGYLAVLLISPEQVYRRWHQPDPDHYLGTWSGQVGGRSATLTVDQQQPLAEGRSYKFQGHLRIAGMPRLDIEGVADSRVVLTARLDEARTLEISLRRAEAEIRSADEAYTRLEAAPGEQPAQVCTTSTDLTQMSTIEACPKVAGNTFFFR